MNRLRKFLFENESVIGIHKSLDILYVKILRLMLKGLFSWPGTEVGENESMIIKKIMNFIYVMIILGALFMGILYIKINFGTLSFFELGHTYITIFMTGINLSRAMTLTYAKRYRDLVKRFFMEFHLFYHKNKSEFSMKTYRQIHQICHLFTLYFAWLIFSGYVLFNITPMYNNYAAGKFKPGGLGNSTFELSVYLAFPFDITRNITAYFMGTAFIWVIAGLCSLWFSSFDLLLSIMVFHLWGHFKILLNDLDSFPVPAASLVQINEITIQNFMYSEANLKMITEMIKNCVKYHRKILGFANEISDVFGPMLFAYYLYFQAVCCVLLLECSQMTAEALVRYLPLTVIMFQQLIQLSCIIEMIGTISEKLPDAVYGLPWEHMDAKNKRTVFIFLINVQNPVYLKAMGVINVGVQPMAAILKTSFSYFTFLRSF